ncbi:TlpA family protein disulfide reductase [Chitinophaga silvatica]|uniref:TlpA family protein disulfide reductase n=1 Tax=Chitinophaga silvatica TaxID=2282649 RepID=A0A3E1YH51_9BACT|nr:TlpA disulfide reductase family protein [Chitinophaga silvatica]RFS26688.1 TlpA family protein disulfide reductase [Chitinophaga silvatica]
MKKILLWAMLLLPVAGICQQQEDKGSTVGLYELHLNEVMAFFSKDHVDSAEVIRDLNTLNTILNKDIGEEALMKEIGALDMVKDSVAFVKLVTTKPAALYGKKRFMQVQFVEEHPDSYVSLYSLETNEGMYSAESYALAYSKLSDRLKNMSAAQGIRDRITALKKLSLSGIKAPDFTRKDQNGKTIKLSDYRGKLVILDFWGSWCGACRQSHPHLKELYDKYKGKGLEIVAVANENVHGSKTPLDTGKAKWLAAIQKDEANWVHVLNDEGTGAPDIVKAYKVGSYPTKFLLDKNGKILLRITDCLNIEIDQMIKSILDK